VQDGIMHYRGTVVGPTQFVTQRVTNREVLEVGRVTLR
jgi:hypothetical protein